jgi:thymidylate synthase (FAD)
MTMERLLMNAAGTNKQAGTIAGAAALDEVNADAWCVRLMGMYRAQQEFYEYGLSIGIPKELARIDLPVGRYSRMRVSANLRNWLAFLTLRQAPNAQWEIRQFADAVASLVAEEFPRTHTLFAKGRA